jgi:hypothetical protein
VYEAGYDFALAPTKEQRRISGKPLEKVTCISSECGFYRQVNFSYIYIYIYIQYILESNPHPF